MDLFISKEIKSFLIFFVTDSSLNNFNLLKRCRGLKLVKKELTSRRSIFHPLTRIGYSATFSANKVFKMLRWPFSIRNSKWNGYSRNESFRMNLLVLKNYTSGILCSSTLFSTTKIIRNDSDPFETSFHWSKIWVPCRIDSVLTEVQCSAAIFTFSRSRDTLLQIALP